jgi:hypothetical protein
MSVEIKNMDMLSIPHSARKSIVDFEESISKLDGVFFGDNDVCPLTHTFSDGIYVREIFIPKGIVLTGKIHLHDHPNFLMKGKVEVFTEFGGLEVLEAPLSMISKAGTKRVVKALEDCVWVTVHKNETNTRDLAILEKEIIAKSYKEYDKTVKSKQNVLYKINFFIKKLLK